MWPFNRKKQANDKKTPKEVEQYYQSEKRERVGLAWLIAFFSLLITVLVVLGLFFGGRWAWRKVTNNDNNGSTAQTTEGTTQPSSQSGTSGAQNEAGTSSGGSSSTSSTNTGSTGSSSSSNAAGSSSAVNQNLTNTGPNNILTVFVIAAVLGTLLHASYSRFKLQKSE